MHLISWMSNVWKTDVTCVWVLIIRGVTTFNSLKQGVKNTRQSTAEKKESLLDHNLFYGSRGRFILAMKSYEQLLFMAVGLHKERII